jgi:hypothetical protein
MEKLKTRNEYVGCNRKCRYFADKEEAYSYKHWCFVKRINGKLVFNDYNYSHTTRRHQNEVKVLLSRLGIKIDVYVYFGSSLSEETFKTNALKAFYSDSVRCIVKNNTKRVRQKTIKHNKMRIEKWRESIKELKAMGAEYSFKQLYQEFKYYKELRNDKEKLIAFVKENKEKVFKHKKDKQFYQVIGRRGDHMVKVFDLAKDVPSYRKYREFYFNNFLNEYSYSPLYSAML